MAEREALAAYKAKRDFTRTPEPAEGGSQGAALRYVIHKHWASRLHYDLRLELDGVLVSWAVPKGPSYDPKDKRMAVHVEDHPVSYADFEGTIPSGQYGAGKVIVWDRGHWQPLGDAERGLREGELKFDLFGEKLRGRWVLVRMKGKGEGQGERQDPWLLIKEKDALARPAADFSVVDEMPESVKAAQPPVARKARAKPGTQKAALPDSLEPQLATLVAAPPTDASDWLFEIKFDGYRLLARIEAGEPRLFTRNGHDWTAKLGSLHTALKRAKLPDGWYDGEIVVHNEHGLPDFGALQRAFDGKAVDEVVYYLFDLPWHDGQDLRDEPLHERRARLEALIDRAASPRLRFSATFDAPAESLVTSACQLGLEGLIGKRRDSAYRSGRSAQWIKLKCAQRQEFVICGWTDPQGGRSGFGALMLGVHDADGLLRHAGNVGSGFDARALAAVKKQLDAVPANKSPFATAPPATAGKPHWVEPTLVAEVSFGEWTRDGHVRHAVFRGLRSDKPARQIVREAPRSAATSRPTASAALTTPAAKSQAQAPTSRLKVTHGERVIDAQSGVTKIELVRYFDLVGALMTSHLKGRPVSLLRAADGIGGELFFQKHIDTAKLAGLRESACAGPAPAIEVVTRAGLLALGQWNAIELHTANMTSRRCDAPDRMIFDLDPGEGVTWPQVQEAAQLVRAFLDQLGLPAFVKTSGGKGLHVVVPLKPTLAFDTVKAFSQAIVKHMAATIPQRFVARSGPKNRVGKIFIDYLRNGEAATTVCAWSPRARPGMGISVPVTWEELPKLRSADHWTVRTAHERLDVGNAPWDGYAKAARGLAAAMRKLGFER